APPSGAPTKKSLRSKRLMRPAAAATNTTNDTKNDDEEAIPAVPELAKNNEAIPELAKNDDEAVSELAKNTEPAEIVAVDTDTETLKPTGKTVDPGSEEEEFVEANESQLSSRHGSPQIKGARPRLDSSFGGQQPVLSPTVSPTNQSLFEPVAVEEEPLFDLGAKVEEPLFDFGATSEEPMFGLGVTGEEPLFDFERADSGATAKEEEEPSMFAISPEAEQRTTPPVVKANEAETDADNLIQLLSSTSEAAEEAGIPGEDTISSDVQATIDEDISVRKNPALGRSISLRYGSGTIGERRRPSLSSKVTNRRSIMLTSFVPPVGMSGGPSSSTSTRSSDDSHGDQTVREPEVDTQQKTKGDAGLTSIRLRPSADVGSAVAKSTLASISERITSDGPGGPPAWVLEVQRRKREAQEKEAEEARVAAAPIAPTDTIVDDDDDMPLTEIDLSPVKESVEEEKDRNKPLPIAPASPSVYVAQAASNGASSRSIYRSLSASLGISQPADTTGKPVEAERQRSTSQASVTSPSPAQSGGLFAAVSSFFGRTSTQVSASESAQLSAMAQSNTMHQSPKVIAFPGMRPSHSEAIPEAPEELDLLQQLEAQNAQILGDNKARVFSQPTPVEAPADDSADWDFWGMLISDYDRVSKTSPRKLARAVHLGIPAPIRGTVWQLMSGSRAESELLGTAFRRLQGQALDEAQLKHEKLIRQDVARTFPRDAYFREAGGPGQEGLYSVLRAYSLYDADVGYCQGLAFVVGPLLLHMPDEEAFCVLVRLMAAYGLRGHFLPAMDDLHLRLFQFDHVLHATLPRLAKHLDQQGVKPTMYASQWLMTLFAYRLPLHLAVRLFDVVFAEGLDALLRVAVAVLKRSQPRLLALEFEAIVHYLNDGPLFAFYAHAAPDTLVRDANQITAVTPRLLQSLRRKYVEETERRMDEEDENARIREECEKLRRDNHQLLLQLQQKQQQGGNGEDLDRLAQKNVQLAMKNQQLEDSLHDMEAALVQIKVLYAESENDRAVLAMKLDGLRKALT
ncbi:GTPase-activating protein, partial [Coemansia sp. S17]